MTEPAAEDRDGRIRRARRAVGSARHELTERANEIEARVPAAHSAVRAYQHDRAVGGEIMAGAIAFRGFVFMIPLVLVLVTTLGIASNTADETAQKVAEQTGISGIAAQSVAQSARVSSGGRWLALFLGLIALYSTSIALARALRIAHALAWGVTVPPMKRGWRAGLVVVGSSLSALFLTQVVSRLNDSSRVAGFVVALTAVLVYAGGWFAISRLLPHGNADWPALLPGAILVGVGVLGLHLVTVFYVSRRIGRSSQLYGSLGAAIAILGWTYLVGRLAVASAVLNASLHRDREQE